MHKKLFIDHLSAREQEGQNLLSKLNVMSNLPTASSPVVGLLGRSDMSISPLKRYDSLKFLWTCKLEKTYRSRERFKPISTYEQQQPLIQPAKVYKNSLDAEDMLSFTCCGRGMLSEDKIETVVGVRCKGMHIAGHMQTDCKQTEKGQSCPRTAYEINANDRILSAYLLG